MNEGKVDIVKQEMAILNTNILEISELKWMGMDKFNSDAHYIYCGQEMDYPHSQKRVWNAVLGCNLKNDSMISVCFQGQPFNIRVIQVYAPITDAKESEAD